MLLEAEAEATLERADPMTKQHEQISGLTDDLVSKLLLSGRANSLREAEGLYLDSCLPEVIRLLQGPLSDEELGRHPPMLRAHGSRGWEETVE